MTEIDINLIWNQVLPLLEKSLNRPVYETLVSSTKPLSYGDGKFEVAVPAQVVKDWLSKFCVSLLEQELRAFVPEIKLVYFTVGPEELFSTPLFEAAAPQKPAHPQRINLSLNFRYTFDSFVVGHGNRFAHAAALAVAESPATAYNPFFLYGGVGLGKTHLMQAIGHRVSLKNPKAKILYTSSEMFTNELINAIRDDKNVQFRNKYRNIDVLMVDDVQFIAGKERTQEEFFHTFNALYEAHKQIVLSSDRPPKEMLTLEERLRSRFEWGLTADVQEPDFETRVAILKKKAEISGITLANEILDFIASRIVSNIRKLEGALIRVVAFSSLNNVAIDIPLVDRMLKDIETPPKSAVNISIDLIKKLAAEHCGVRPEDMTAKIRTEKIAGARQMAMFLARELTGASLPKIGNEFGGRDHTTVLHACEKIRASIKRDARLADDIRTISAAVKKFTPRTV
ncbi:chromosomal replication initiation protein DnaA [candidate division WOR-1 bacterium RIFCSPHIGHO2_01_FULL_53_15]|uniref:Chromosomal replication initiator protein DnaA n=1 Tax=candidate division WOR-1 bacterium RIFCSPHIGHO2_01_FULL_53_15 TaxID=1802564 RepID=A0A1F4PZ92_UNCSA|nr:MAG: chromosomal replication initiation protein DnaA [candidate division WOR-1 bacterium RIFCSPHIGHO2_01_FULL_53_15]OGC10622.1 MAG: chromosomal replication initiation protein DnaA [candidate division WOR-1 bacterium RIFCSPHIGHO2_02_FULL_53_26]